MSTEDEHRHIATRMRVICAIERINRLLDEPEPAGHGLSDEALEVLVGCMNAVSEIVERRLALD